MFSVMLITGAVSMTYRQYSKKNPIKWDPSEYDPATVTKLDALHLTRVKQKECYDKVLEKRNELNLPGFGPHIVNPGVAWKPEYAPDYSKVLHRNGKHRPLKMTGYGECMRLTKDNCEKMGGTFSDAGIFKSKCNFKTPDPKDPDWKDKTAPKPYTTLDYAMGLLIPLGLLFVAGTTWCQYSSQWDDEPRRDSPKPRKPRRRRDDDDDPCISDDDDDSKKHGGGGGGDDDVINDQDDPSFWDRITDSSSSIFIPFWVIVGLLVLGLIGGCVACIVCSSSSKEDEYDLEYGPRSRSRSRSRSGFSRSRTPSGYMYSRSRTPSGFSRTPGFTPGRSRTPSGYTRTPSGWTRTPSGRSRTPGRTPSCMSRMTRSRTPSGHSLSRWKSSRSRRSRTRPSSTRGRTGSTGYRTYSSRTPVIQMSVSELRLRQ